MRSLISGAVLVVAASLSAQAEESRWQKLMDMDRADMREFSMQMINEGNPAGGMTYGWRREGSTYVISDRTEMQPNILETATGVIDAATFLPISNNIDFAVGASRNVFDVTWQEGARTGSVEINQEGQAPRTVDLGDPNQPKSIIRLSIFGVIAAMPLAENFSVDVPWYNTLSNAIETVTLAHVGFDTVETPAGTYETHKVHIQNGTPENMVYVTRALPHKVVRIDVLGRPMHFERLP